MRLLSAQSGADAHAGFDTNAATTNPNAGFDAHTDSYSHADSNSAQYSRTE